MASQSNKYQSKEDTPVEKGKMFIGGLNWETTMESLQLHFSRYGEVVDCVVMKNPETGRSRGFGFITFADPSCVDLVLQNTPHILDNKTIEPKPCNPRTGTVKAPRRNAGGNTIFLGGLPSNFTEIDLRNFFSQYGKVVEVIIKYDQEKQTCRGFGFLTFDSEESVERCCNEHYVSINGKQVEIKKAEPREARGSFSGPGRGKYGGGWESPGMHGGGMGQMPRPMGPMGRGMMSGGYQGGWAGPGNQGGYGYGPHGGYQGWGPQGNQWGPGAYGGGPGGNYGYGPQGGPGPHNSGGSGYNNWNGWGGPQGGPVGPGGPSGPNVDMGYGRGPGANNVGPTPAGPASAGPGPGPGPVPVGMGGANVKTDHYGNNYGNGYGSNGGYNSDGNPSYRGNGYDQGNGYSQGNGGYSQGGSQGYVGSQGYGNSEGIPTPANVGMGAPGVGGPTGPGPQRGGNYTQPSQSQYHPYRR